VRDRDLAAELERLLLIVVHFLPRLAARIRLRAADERLGAWATGLSDPQDPAVAAARERATEAQRAAISARAAAAANWRQAGDAAQLSARLVSQAVADVLGWVAHGIRSGSSMLVAWLVSVAVVARRRLRIGSAAAGRHVRAGSVATRDGLRSGSVATREGLRAGSVAAGRGVRGAGAGLAGAAGGLASRIDALADRRTGRHGRSGNGSAASADARADATHADVGADTQVGGPVDLDRPGPPENGTDAPARPGNGTAAPPADATGVAATQGLDGARNGHHDGTGRGRLVLDPADPVEAWWLPSSIADPAPQPSPSAGRRARRAAPDRAGRDPVVAGLAGGLGRVARPFRAIGSWLAPLVTAMAAPPNHRRRGLLAFARPVVVALALTLVVATATAVPAGMLVADSVKGAGAGLPELEELRQLRQPERTQVYDRRGRVIEVLKDEQDRIVVPLDKISPLLQNAVIAAEDARFYEHKGVDDRGIMRAAVTNLLTGQVSQGGSTITQQLVRNSYPDLKDISIVRKIKEAALAAQLEGKLSKQEILHRYLNRVYFGAGYYGVEAASKGYFGKHASEVTLAQAATLAGVIREPVSSEPRAHPDRAKLLRDSVLQRMAQLGMVPAERVAKAQKLPVRIQPPRTVGGRYPWFIDGLRRQLQDDPRLGKTKEGRTQRLFEGGLRIHTTLDADMQRAAEQAVDRLRPPTGPDIALVAIDPRDGGVRAVVGGRNWEKGSYNAALQGPGRQPGSSFKTFVLTAALDAGISPDSVWESSGFDQLVCGTRWNVANYEGGGSGPVSVRDATRRSVNGVYGRLMEKLCPEKVASMAERLGIPTIAPRFRTPAMALGSAEVHPIDMASAYATLANLGEYHKPTFFEKIDHRSGKPVIDEPNKGERRISAALAWQVTDILKGVIRGGTGTRANIGRPAAGKTGTNQSYRDAWFVGYTPQLAVAVWMGYPEGQKSMFNVQGVARVAGGTIPAQVWHDFMAVAMANQPVMDWPKPSEQLTYTILPPPPKKDEDKDKKDRKKPGKPRKPGKPGRND
jgi:penicillin-binding protein 1A